MYTATVDAMAGVEGGGTFSASDGCAGDSSASPSKLLEERSEGESADDSRCVEGACFF